MPPLEWDDGSWVGEIVLPSWSGYLSCRGRYNARDREEPNDGRVRVRFARDGERHDPSLAQRAALAFVTAPATERAVARAVVGAIFDRYAGWREKSMLDGALLDEIMPRIKARSKLRSLMGVGWVHILEVAKDGLAYVGFELGCTWEEEHGAGVVLHGTRVVDVGAAEVAFASWEPEKDRDRRVEPTS